MENNIKISYCLSVFNVRPYLKNCIRSIYAQHFEGFEIICVDDCSTDGSLEELYRLAAKHPEMTVIHNEVNSGAAFSRNTAIRKARGEYVWIIDSDDMLVPNSAKVLYDTAKKTGARACLGKIYYVDNLENGLPRDSGTDTYKFADYSEPDEYYGSDQYGSPSFSSCLGLYDRKYLKKNRLLFREELRRCEDMMFLADFGVQTDKIVHVDHYCYYYFYRGTSKSNNSASKRTGVEAYIQILEKFEELKKRYPQYKYTLDAVGCHLTMKCVRNLAIYICDPSDEDFVCEKLDRLKKNGWYPYKPDLNSRIFYTPNEEYNKLLLDLNDEAVFQSIRRENVMKTGK